MSRWQAGSRSMTASMIGAEGGADLRFARDHIEIGLPDQIGRDFLVPEPRGEPMDDRQFQSFVIEDGFEDPAGKLRIAPHDLFGLVPDARRRSHPQAGTLCSFGPDFEDLPNVTRTSSSLESVRWKTGRSVTAQASSYHISGSGAAPLPHQTYPALAPEIRGRRA